MCILKGDDDVYECVWSPTKSMVESKHSYNSKSGKMNVEIGVSPKINTVILTFVVYKHCTQFEQYNSWNSELFPG